MKPRLQLKTLGIFIQWLEEIDNMASTRSICGYILILIVIAIIIMAAYLTSVWGFFRPHP
jgi:hypothetical protein